ncbi:translocation/assembly module TamB domain-containing protein [Amaricoccus macauensis]|uniref:translocation/assembly module TamB domain-containing protein n=1 Tax=Amaricoccus macauensis TaxID=57001 RepID=UPI003C7CE9C9
MRRFAAILGATLVLGLAAFGQEQETADADADQATDNGFILNFIQEKISGPGREITLSGVEGALSSQARIGGITVADDEGVWLRIENVVLDWNRLALLRRRVAINELSFDRIDLIRKPIPVETAPQVEAESDEPFSLPDLPVAVRLDRLLAETVSVGEDVAGEAFDFRLEGNAALEDGALESGLDIRRLDEPGGTITLEANYANEDRQIRVDLDLNEPAGGLLSTLANIEGQPPLSLTVAGEGPLDNVDIDFDLQADQTTLADGVLALRGQEDGQGFDLGLRGEIGPLIPAQYRDFFAGETRIDLAGVSKSEGGVRLDLIGLQGAVMNLNGRLETAEDNFLRSLNLSGSLGDPADEPVLLPVPGAETRLNSAILYLNYGGASRWDGIVALDRLDAAGLTIEDFTLDMGGRAQNLDDPAARDVTVNIEGRATGVSSTDPEVAEALGSELDLFVDAALPPGAPIDLRQVQVTGESLSLFVSGLLDGLEYDGRASVRVPDLAILSGIANRNLGGGVTLRANGSVDAAAGKFDLTLDGSASDLEVGDPRADGLLAGETLISGRAVRDERGIRTEDLSIRNPQLEVSSDGSISSSSTDIDVSARIEDLGLVDPRFAGALTVDGRASGQGQPVSLEAAIALPEGQIMDQAARNLRIGFDGEKDGDTVRGQLDGTGSIADLALDLAGAIEASQAAQSVQDLALSFGALSLAGDLSREEGQPIEGNLDLRAPDLGQIGEVAALDLAGTVYAALEFGGEASGDAEEQEVRQDLSVRATINGFALGETVLDDLYADLDITDLTGVPMAEGEINGSGITAGGVDIASLTTRATREGDASTRIDTNARLAIGTLADLEGVLEALPDNGFKVDLEEINIRRDTLAATLAEPSTITVQGGDVDISPLRLDLGDGYLSAQGAVSDELSLDVDLSEVPLTVGNLIRPALDLRGTLSGRADITGQRDAPSISFDLAGNELGSGYGDSIGLPAISLDASGETSDQILTVDADLTGANSTLSLTADGEVPLAAEKNFDLTVDLASFPLAMVDRLAGGQGLRGTLTGQAQISGAQSAPEVTFDIAGDGLTASILADNDVPPFALNVAGDFAENAVTLSTLQATGPYGFDLSGGGRIPLSGDGLDARLSGVVPLQMATPVLAQRAASATGQLNIDASATGSLAEPQTNGTITLANGTFTDPETNLRLENISLDVALDMTQVVVNRLRAESAAGGDVTANGTVSLAAAQGFPADLTVNFDEIRYTDGAFLSTGLDGELDVTGPLTGGGRISGDIVLQKTEISIAEGLGGSAGAAVDEIRHLRPPPRVVRTLDRAQVNLSGDENGGSGGDGGSGGLALDIEVTAPNQIFIRGRGLDAELGGAVDIGGTTSDPAPVGEFEMRRGRISILTQRIDFTEGTLELDGELDPLINFVAESTSGDVTAIVTVSGRASDPEITFSSSPELPEDEVLSRLLFNRAAQDLSPFQLAQLAAAAAELAGVSSGPGILSELRGATGLDNLDVLTAEDGSTAVSAGKYVADDVYLDVQTDSKGESRAEIVYDVNDNFTARGSVGSDGNTIFGIFFERDY